ncbi:predicted protein, partial [Nematostella vectensis]
CSQSTEAIFSSEHDYVICGAGSAGCVLANRLSADPDSKVLLLEAGPKDRTWKIHMPAALIYNLCDDKYNWYYHTAPQKHMNNRVMYCPRGRVWGGSSSLNAMVYIRGHAYDYDRWEREGAQGWSYADCLPYFRKSQTHELGADDYRGGDGPLHVSRGKTNNPLFHAFLEGAQQAGYPFTEDMNGYQQEGVGWMAMTIHKGIRWNTANAYLRPAIQRTNLHADTRALITRVLFEGNKAVGVEYHADNQVGLLARISYCAGGYPHPHQRSSPSNTSYCRGHPYPILVLFSQVEVIPIQYLVLFSQVEVIPIQYLVLFSQVEVIPIQYLVLFSQVEVIPIQYPVLFSQVEVIPIQYPGLFSQVEVIPIQYPVLFRRLEVIPIQYPVFFRRVEVIPIQYPVLFNQVEVIPIQYLVLFSQVEVIPIQYLVLFSQVEVIPIQYLVLFRRIEVIPIQYPRLYPSCTCKMGSASDPLAVVDNAARVFHVDNLRVVDASIMPSVVSGNLNAPTVMIAEKIADAILGKDPLPRSKAPVFKTPEKGQR